MEIPTRSYEEEYEEMLKNLKNGDENKFMQ